MYDIRTCMSCSINRVNVLQVTSWHLQLLKLRQMLDDIFVIFISQMH